MTGLAECEEGWRFLSRMAMLVDDEEVVAMMDVSLCVLVTFFVIFL